MILSALVFALAAPHQNTALPAGYYGFETIARALSTPEAPVTAAKALRQRVVYLDLKDASQERLRKVLRATSDVILVRDGTKGRLRLESDPIVLRREARERDMVATRLREKAARIGRRTEALGRAAESPEEASQRLQTKFEALGHENGAIDAATADAYEEIETELWAVTGSTSLATPESAIAHLHASETLSRATGASFADPPPFEVWTTEVLDAIARRRGDDADVRRRLMGYGGVRTRWRLGRSPGRLSLTPQSLWLNPERRSRGGDINTMAFLPGDGRETPMYGLVQALYVGFPGSRWSTPLLGTESRERYAALDRSTIAFLATEEGRGLATAFSEVEGRERPLSHTLREWAKGTGTEVAFELAVSADSYVASGAPFPLRGFSGWRFARIEGTVVATNLLDFLDRAIPIPTLAVAPLLLAGPRDVEFLTETEVRAFYAATGAETPWKSAIPPEYYRLPFGMLAGGSAAFAAYEAARSRPELRSVLRDGGTVGIPLAGLGVRGFASVVGAFGSDVRFSPYRTEDPASILETVSAAFTVRAVPEGREVQVLIDPNRIDPNRAGERRAPVLGLGSTVRFLIPSSR